MLLEAIALADRAGIEALTMRRLAQEVGVEAMTLYYHVGNKDDLLSAMVDAVVGEFELPSPDDADWKAALRRTAISAHTVLLRHRWAAGLMLSPGRRSTARLVYMEAVLGCLRRGGFTAELTDLAYHALESHISGFTLWQVTMDLVPDELPALAAAVLEELPADRFPFLIEHIHLHLDHRSAEGEGSFAFGLDLLLDGLERIRDARAS